MSRKIKYAPKHGRRNPMAKKGKILNGHFPGRFQFETAVVAFVLEKGYNGKDKIPKKHRGGLNQKAAQRVARNTLKHIEQYSDKAAEARKSLLASKAKPEVPEFHLAKRTDVPQPELATV